MTKVKVDDQDVVEMAKEVTRMQFAQYGMINIPEQYLDDSVKEMLCDTFSFTFGLQQFIAFEHGKRRRNETFSLLSCFSIQKKYQDENPFGLCVPC